MPAWLLALLLLASSARSEPGKPPALPDWARELGLKDAAEGGLRHRGADGVERALDAREEERARVFLQEVDAERPRPDLARKARVLFGDPGASGPFFERAGGGVPLLSSAGRAALVPALLQGVSERAASPTLVPPPFSSHEIRRALDSFPKDASVAAARFDGTRQGPPPLAFSWGTAPASEAIGRNIETVYRWYDYGTDALRHALTDSSSPGLRRAARVAKAPLDWAAAWAAYMGQHESGHLQTAWMNGAGSASWEPEDGPYAFGRIVNVPDEEWYALSQRDRLAVNAAGLAATQVGYMDMRRRSLEGERFSKSVVPLAFMENMDWALYMAGTPRPGEEDEEDASSDVIQLRDAWASLSGRSRGAVHADMTRAALFRAADPFALAGVFKYVKDYLVHGREELSNPMIPIGRYEWLPGTAAWPTPSGIEHRANLFVRDPRSGLLLDAGVTFGEAGSGVDMMLSNIPLSEGLRARAGAGIWSQREFEGLDREFAEEHVKRGRGDGKLGGFVSAGLGWHASRALSGWLDVGYKSEGEMPGQRPESGVFCSFGLCWQL